MEQVATLAEEDGIGACARPTHALQLNVSAGLAQHSECCDRQRNNMLRPSLHAGRGSLPPPILEIELRPTPWITIPNLGSHILSLVRRQLPDDWTERYNTTPVLIETFVETPRFTGALYKASG